uniref:AlNc14C233G9334 protein n=1 Tax=Albugo laibachii Nc14 TaxID=890382 RepID=F0WSJ0_9STRA|nr:AlNc14C233G9334 [Albugo laibachii Nc14]|eukprot:CCA24315.1 AlNc14C233G9334 [Albugo laibachii Nc14]
MPLTDKTGTSTDDPRGIAPSESISGDKDISMPSSPDRHSSSPEDKVLPPTKATATTPSQQVTPVHVLPPRTIVRSGNKRNRSIDSFKSLVSKAPPRQQQGLAITNYFDVLQSIDVEYSKIDATKEREFGNRYQIVPSRIETPHSVASSKEAAHFLRKNHTRVEKDDRPTRVGEVVDLFIEDIKTAKLINATVTLHRADIHVSKAAKHVLNTSNGDNLIKFGSKHPIALHGVLLKSMRDNVPALAEMARAHMINRVLAASGPSSDNTFLHKWVKRVGGNVPSKRQELFAFSVTHWWSDSPAMDELQRVTLSLSFFGLMLMSTAPSLFNSDHWIQHTCHLVLWIPAHHCRLLSINSLLLLLRSTLGSLFLSEWFDAHWDTPLLNDLAVLQRSTAFLPEEASILQLTEVAGVQTLVAGSLGVFY